jgi:hypothetical protein
MSLQPLNDEKFEAVILQHPFAELSQEQKSDLGISDMSAEEYEAIRSVIRELHALENDAVVPSTALKNTLLKAFDEPPAKEKRGTILLWSSLLAGVAAVFIVAIYVLPLLNPVQKQGAQKENTNNTSSEATAVTSSTTDAVNQGEDKQSQPEVQSPLLANNNTVSENEAVLNETQVLENDFPIEPPAEVKLDFENTAAGATATEDMEMSDAPSKRKNSEVKATKKSMSVTGSLGGLGMDLLTTIY